jgi:hypothetical protein
VAAPWVKQYDFRFVDGNPDFGGAKEDFPASARSPNCGSATGVPRKIDVLSLMSMSDAYFGRVFHARRERVPFGTVSLTTYFHADAADLAAEDITRVLAVPTPGFFIKAKATRTGNSGRRMGTC